MLTVSSRDFFYIVFKRKKIIIGFLLTSIMLGMFFSFLSTPAYEADAKILVKIGRENIYNPEGQGSNPLFTPNKEEQINSEIEILKSPSLLTEVIKAIGVETLYPDLNGGNSSFFDHLFSRSIDMNQGKSISEAVRKLQNNIFVERIPKSDVIQIGFEHSDPVMTARVVNTWVDLFFDTHINIHITPQSLDFYRKQSELLRKKLNEGELKRAAFVERYNITDPEEERKLLMKQISSINIELNKTISEIAEVDSRINEIHNQLDKTKELIARNERIKHSPKRINSLKKLLSELLAEKKQLIEKLGKSNLQVSQVQNEIEKVQSELAEQDKIRHLASHDEIESVYQGLLKKISNNEIEAKALKASKQTMMAKLSDYQNKLEKIAKIETEYNDIEQKIAVDRQNYSLYLSKLEGSRISKAMNQEKISNVRLINPAQVPVIPKSPTKVLNLIISILFGLIGGFGLAFFLEFFDDSLETETDVEEVVNLPVLASISAH